MLNKSGLYCIFILLCCCPRIGFAESIKITIPKENAAVSMEKNKIEFITDVPANPDDSPVVFLKDPSNQWWPWLQSQSDDNRKNWKMGNMQIGNSNDSKNEFTIQIIIFSKVEIDEGIQLNDKVFIENGTAIKNSIMQRIIATHPLHSIPVNVIRK